MRHVRRYQTGGTVVALATAVPLTPLDDPWTTLVQAHWDTRVRAGMRPATCRLDLDNLAWTRRRLEEAAGGPVDPRRVSREDLLRLVDRMVDDARKGTTINKRITAWHGFFAFLVAEQHTGVDPSARIPRVREDVPSVEHLDREELRTLLRYIRHRTGSIAQLRTRAVTALIIDCGVRLAEAQRVALDGLDLNHRLLHLQGSQTKNRRPRNVPLGRLSITYLQDYLRERHRRPDRNPRLFAGVRGKPFNRDALWETMAHWATAAGIHRRVTPHVLRHTFAVNYLLGNGDSYSLHRIMGHVDPKVLEQYLQFRDQELGMLRDRADPTAALSDLINLEPVDESPDRQVAALGSPVRRSHAGTSRRTAAPDGERPAEGIRTARLRQMRLF